MTTPRELLVKARENINRPELWLQEEQSGILHVDGEQVVGYCAWGALVAAAEDAIPGGAEMEYNERMEEVFASGPFTLASATLRSAFQREFCETSDHGGAGCIADYNDDVDTKHGQVLAAYDAAIGRLPT